MNTELSTGKKPLEADPTIVKDSSITPRDLVVYLSIFLIVGGILLIFQPWFFSLYQMGLISLMIGAYVQIILGNIAHSVTYGEVLKTFGIGTVVFSVVVSLAIWLAPKLTSLL